MKLINQIVRLLRSGAVTIEHRAIKEYGLCYNEQRIVIRRWLCERNKVKTLIHECLHCLYPELSEESVRMLEKDVYDNLTTKQYGILVFFLEDSE